MDPDRIFSRLNPLFRWLLRAPVLHHLVSPGLLLLTVTGRRTGRRYDLPVGYRRSGNDLVVLVSKARRKQWWRNYLEERPIELRLRGAARSGRAAVVAPDAPAFRDAVEIQLRSVPGLSRAFGVDFDRSHGLTPEQLGHLASEIAVVRIRLDPD
jgi:hypothetical protein